MIAALLALVAAAAPLERPNVVFVLADDLGWTDLGCFGSTFYETPHLDALAADGMRFTQAYAACPVCSPTRASIMTGKAPARLDTTDYFGGRRAKRLLPAPYLDRLPLEEVTIAEALGAAGYRTGFFGKWHLGPEGFWPENQGFDVNVGGFTRGMPPKGYFSPYGNPRLPDGFEGEHLTERLTDEALGWLADVGDEPFFLMFSTYQVHTPLQTTPALKEKYEEKRDALPPSDAPRFLPEGARQARQVQDHAVYAGMVESLDTAVGRLRAALGTLGVAENTIFVFFSDNGGLSTSEGSPTSNVPLRAGKGWLYEGGVREPMIVTWPDVVAAGAVCGEPVISMDFYPTLLAACGVLDPGGPRDGVDLLPLLRGTATALAPRPLYWHYPHYGNQGGAPGGAVRWGDWKLIEWFEEGRSELFHLGRDLGETTDLSAREPERTAVLRQRLRAWRDEVDAKLPRPNPSWPKPRKRGS